MLVLPYHGSVDTMGGTLQFLPWPSNKACCHGRTSCPVVMGSETTMTVGLGYKAEPWPVAMGSKTTMAVGPWKLVKRIRVLPYHGSEDTMGGTLRFLPWPSNR